MISFKLVFYIAEITGFWILNFASFKFCISIFSAWFYWLSCLMIWSCYSLSLLWRVTNSSDFYSLILASISYFWICDKKSSLGLNLFWEGEKSGVCGGDYSCGWCSRGWVSEMRLGGGFMFLVWSSKFVRWERCI